MADRGWLAEIPFRGDLTKHNRLSGWPSIHSVRVSGTHRVPIQLPPGRE